jgi:Ca-activated chloride channel family protein
MGDAIDLALDASGAVPDATPTPDAPASPGPSATPDATAEPDPSASPEADAVPVVAEVVLSDGANSTGTLEPIEAAQRAADLGVPIYTIALGTSEGTVDVPNMFGMTDQLPVPPDPETLATIAEMTGGRFFEAPTAEELAAIYESLGSKVGYVEEEQEVTQLFAAAGLLFVLVGGALAAHWFNRFP